MKYDTENDKGKHDDPKPKKPADAPPKNPNSPEGDEGTEPGEVNSPGKNP